MSWLALTEANLLTTLSSSELEGYRAAALAVGQTDPVQPTIDLVVNMVRGYCQAGGFASGAAVMMKMMLFRLIWEYNKWQIKHLT